MSLSNPLYLQARAAVAKILQDAGVHIQSINTLSVKDALNNKAVIQLIETDLVCGHFVLKADKSLLVKPEFTKIKCVMEIKGPTICLNLGVYHDYIMQDTVKKATRKPHYFLYWEFNHPEFVWYVHTVTLLELVEDGYTGSTPMGENVVFIPATKAREFNPNTWLKMQY